MKKIFIIILISLLIPELCFAGFFSNDDSDKENNKEALEHPSLDVSLPQLFANISPETTIAFAGIMDNNGEKTGFSNDISHIIEPKIVKFGSGLGLTFIERNDLNLILNEWKLDMNGIVAKGDNGARALIGADLILVGKTSHKRPFSHVSLKLTRLSDGKILSVIDGWEKTDYELPSEKQEVAQKSTEAKAGKSANESLNFTSSPDGSLNLWTSQKEYKIGDNLIVNFEVTKPMYVKLFDATPDGEITAIFPNPFQPDNYCQPGIKYQIPPPGAPFALEVTGPEGLDRIKAVASTTQVELGTQVKTRGIKFTKQLVENSSTSTNISFKIH